MKRSRYTITLSPMQSDTVNRSLHHPVSSSSTATAALAQTALEKRGLQTSTSVSITESWLCEHAKTISGVTRSHKATLDYIGAHLKILTNRKVKYASNNFSRTSTGNSLSICTTLSSGEASEIMSETGKIFSDMLY